ncbi:MAG: hypothetical protein BWY06_02586 [Candidatus Latescibacteria bacterium ADurb.Bin168]|nr:MAG: hypothetical protein BWY06_02586 [Candidatus Latescibacteria bacterium ADurb.Bin168]
MFPTHGAGASRYNSLACARESLDDRRVVRPNTVIEWRLCSRRCIEMTIPPPSSTPFHSACAVPESVEVPGSLSPHPRLEGNAPSCPGTRSSSGAVEQRDDARYRDVPDPRRRCVSIQLPRVRSRVTRRPACGAPEYGHRVARWSNATTRGIEMTIPPPGFLPPTHQLWQNVVFVSRVLVKNLQICTRIFSRGDGMAHAKTRRTRRRAGFSVGAPPRGRPPPQTRKQTRADTGVCVRDAHDALQNG